jgi:predicted acyltransferase
VFASGGWVLIMLAFLYWLTDVKKFNQYAWPFVAVGMNAIFIYLFFETVGHQWLNGVAGIFVKGFLSFAEIQGDAIAVISALVTLFAEWYLCYWLFKKKLFFKL